MDNFLFKDEIETVLMDWHGILSKRGFWCNQYKANKNLAAWCDFIFRDELLHDWMRNILSFDELCAKTASKFGLTRSLIMDCFEKDIEEYGPKWELCLVLEQLFPKARKVLFSDNPDIFKFNFLNKRRQLFDYFDDIILSCDYGVLKKDRNPGLFDKALTHLNLANFKNSVLIDDNSEHCAYFLEKGGHVINII